MKNQLLIPPHGSAKSQIQLKRQSGLHKSALLAGFVHVLALVGVTSAAHFTSNSAKNELAAMTATFEALPSSIAMPIEKSVTFNKTKQPIREQPIAQAIAPNQANKSTVEHIVTTTALMTETVMPAPRDSEPGQANSQAAPSQQKPAAPAVASVAVVNTPANTPAIFDAAYLNNPPPSYPPVSRLRGEAGTTMLRVHISAEGKALDVAVNRSSGSSKLDQAAANAVLKWRFVPSKRGGISTSSWVTIPIEFTLDKTS